MKLPRDVSGADLVKLLAAFGYEPTRQVGSHVRLTTSMGGNHSITVPMHVSLRVKTLDTILLHVAMHLGLGRDDVLEKLFG